jgi:hypothetical protein
MIINSKLVLAFAAGAIVASGIVYVALKPSARPVHVAAVATPAPAPKPVPSAAEPASAPAPEPAAEPEPPKSVIHERHAASAPQHAAEPPAQVARAAPPPDDVPASVRMDENPAPAPAPQVAEPPAPEPAPEAVTEAPSQTLTPPPPPNRVTLAAGTPINVRLAEALSTDKNEKGDTFFATLDQPLAAGGFVLAERGARVEGRVVDAVRSGRGNAAAHLALALTKIHTSDGQTVGIETAEFDKKGDASGGENAAKVGGGAVLGAIIGAMAGGGKGAGIGAAAGGAAGAGGVLLTRGRAATLPTETRITFHLQQAVTVTERAR